jgi:Fe-S-cluster containining protein
MFDLVSAPERSDDWPEATKAVTTLCDHCVSPGACCRGFMLSESGSNMGKVSTATQANVTMATKGYPFLAEEYKTRDGGYFVFSCPMLDDNGRCSIYEFRPKTCRVYQPASDGLCAMRPWVGSPDV